MLARLSHEQDRDGREAAPMSKTSSPESPSSQTPTSFRTQTVLTRDWAQRSSDAAVSWWAGWRSGRMRRMLSSLSGRHGPLPEGDADVPGQLAWSRTTTRIGPGGGSRLSAPNPGATRRGSITPTSPAPHARDTRAVPTPPRHTGARVAARATGALLHTQSLEPPGESQWRQRAPQLWRTEQRTQHRFTTQPGKGNTYNKAGWAGGRTRPGRSRSRADV